MIQHFSLRGYPLTDLLTHLSKVAHIPRQSLFQKPTSSSTQKHNDDNDKDITLYLITTYNPANPNIAEIINKFWPILGRSSGTR